MKKNKSQTMRILDGFVTAVVVVTSATLVASGVCISRMNTEYLETGVRAAKIVAERESRQIFLTENESIKLVPDKNYYQIADKVLSFLPPPINTVYITAKEIKNAVESSETNSGNF